jgi:hypothetical protein
MIHWLAKTAIGHRLYSDRGYRKAGKSVDVLKLKPWWRIQSPTTGLPSPIDGDQQPAATR